MASKVRAKMTIEDRAKQFMPFSAITGLEKVLATKEKILVDRIERTEYLDDILDERMHHLSVGDMVTAIYYSQDEYVKITGLVAKIDRDARLLQIVNTKISFDDLYDIVVEE